MLDKYSPAEIETKHYQNWEKQGYFAANFACPESFSIQLPPPNVTGTLHMGHAFNQTIMDGLTRYYRMKGRNTAWIPGTDHAGIATQIVVERQLAAEGVSRHDLGREKFLEKVWAWKNLSGGTITQQMRRVGCSADWQREYFTMDDARAQTVTEVFVRLFEQGLIYRGKRLVNWDPVLGTAVSDLEVESVEEDGSMWHIRYPLVDGSDGLIVATTRPETMLGDVAVAVHPEDERYARFIGKELVLPLTGRTIPVIADEYVEKDFGTGCVKITPAHDFNDYEVGKRHDTKLVNIFDLTAKILSDAEVFNYKGEAQPGFRLPEQYAGLDRFAARKQIVADLKEQGFLQEIKPHKLMTPKGDRTGSVIEPMLTSQWFVAMSAAPQGGEPESEYQGLSLAEKAKRAVDSGAVRFIPENWVNTYNQWMNNIQDWCISRQLWWGHQIPAWYDESGNYYVARSEADAQAQAGGAKLTRDEDVLDTWFSSALVPFSTLGWPSETPELKAFLPSNVLVTGYEIIFFWVARMIMMTTHFTGKVPFKDVYIHGIVRDHEGKKMSKSEGNVIDPVDLIDGIDLEKLLIKRTTGLRKPETAPAVKKTTEKLFPEGIPAMGADALRFTMASYASLGRSVNFDFKRAEGYRNFCNKLWNATNFVLMNTENQDCGQDETQPLAYTFADQWIIGRLQQTEAAAAEAFETYRFDLAAQTLYEFVWNEYCDWYIELAKVQIQTGCPTTQRTTRRTLVRVLETILRLLHPIMPFITEELWQHIAERKEGESIMCQCLKIDAPTEADNKLNADIEIVKQIVSGVRMVRNQKNIAPKEQLSLQVIGQNHYAQYDEVVTKMANIDKVEVVKEKSADTAQFMVGTDEYAVPIGNLVDIDAEIKKQEAQLAHLEGFLAGIKKKLSNERFVANAPEAVVALERKKQSDSEEKIAALKASIEELKKK